MTDSENIILGIHAKDLIDNPVNKMIWDAMGSYLDAKTLACKTDDHKQAADIVRCKQLLAGMKREADIIISRGLAAQEMEQIKEKKIKMKEMGDVLPIRLRRDNY